MERGSRTFAGFVVLCSIRYLSSIPSGAFIGINIGMEFMRDLPSANDVLFILKSHHVTHVRLYDADHQMLNALANTGIAVMVGVNNDELHKIGENQTAAADWVNKNVAAFLPKTNITAIAVGNEVLTTYQSGAPHLVPAMNLLYHALVATNLDLKVKVSSPHSMDTIALPYFPPSTATFNPKIITTMYLYLQFLKNTESFFMLNAHPYYGYTTGNATSSIDYALLKPRLARSKQIVDSNTGLRYLSMFDAMVDAAYYSMGALNFSGMPVVVTESGWPSIGGANEPDATMENAQTYVTNLIHRVFDKCGSPSQPQFPTSTYIYELFNEDIRPGPLSKKNWGLFYTNGTAMHSQDLIMVKGNRNSSGCMVFCVAKKDAKESALEAALNWACGIGNASCGAIQKGQPCYKPNNLHSHASYAFNDYYQRMRSSGGTSCDFWGTAIITTKDPSKISAKGSLIPLIFHIE
ncbi:hypothetical protein Scep_020753 [Stephania cephalantha]|uniref:glucan endo-1,3-beta-D-glucosidase n=1 Tax=Stephania cephalantha TaxID=152367 RepID=A0AAP0ID46_9MAGN